MTQRPVTHATFTIERTFNASPERVFEAFADAKVKERWFSGPPEWGPAEHTMDFRAGGHETSKGGPKGGPASRFEAIYHEIVPAERIIFSYDMFLDEQRISVSLATIEFTPGGAGTQMTFTEQGAFFEGDGAELREQGMHQVLDRLAAEVERKVARA